MSIASFVAAVVPVVEQRGRDQVFQRSQLQPEVGMHQPGLEPGPHDVAEQRRVAGAQDERRQHDHRPRHQRLQEVQARAGHPVHALHAVVHGMEAPQRRHLVHGAVRRVFHQVGRHQHGEELHQAGQGPEPVLQPGIHRPGEQRRHGPHAHEQEDADRQVVEDEVAAVVPEIRPQDRLVGPVRHDLLQRDEHGGGGQQVQDEPVEPDEARRVVARPDRHRAAAQVHRHRRQQHAERAQPLLPVQHEGQQAEPGGEHQPGRQQRAHQPQVVAGPQRRRGQ